MCSVGSVNRSLDRLRLHGQRMHHAQHDILEPLALGEKRKVPIEPRIVAEGIDDTSLFLHHFLRMFRRRSLMCNVDGGMKVGGLVHIENHELLALWVRASTNLNDLY